MGGIGSGFSSKESAKRMAKIMFAVRAGASTSPEVARRTGLSIQMASIYLQRYAKYGLLRRCPRMIHDLCGRPPYFYRTAPPRTPDDF